MARLCDWVAISLVALFTGTIAVSVFFRYVLGDALTWSEEFARFTMVAMVFVAAAPALRHGEHVALDLIAPVLPPRAQSALALVIASLIAGFLAVLGYHGVHLMIATSDQTTASLGLSRAVPYAVIPIGALLMLVQVAVLMLRHCAAIVDPGGLGAPAVPRPAKGGS